MPRIDTFRRLLAFISSLVIILLGIVGFVHEGFMIKIFGANVANQYVYPIIGDFFQILAYIFAASFK